MDRHGHLPSVHPRFDLGSKQSFKPCSQSCISPSLIRVTSGAARSLCWLQVEDVLVRKPMASGSELKVRVAKTCPFCHIGLLGCLPRFCCRRQMLSQVCHKLFAPLLGIISKYLPASDETDVHSRLLLPAA